MTRRALALAVAAGLSTCVGHSAGAAEWLPNSGAANWGDSANWDTGVPNGVGAVATFTGTNTAANSATLNGNFTVGSLTFDSTGSTGNNDFRVPGTAPNSLTFDNGGAGATITTQGTGVPNNDLSGPLVFADNVTAQINQTTSQSAAGSLDITATVTGAGGFTKSGDGLATFGTNAKTYTGASVFNGGRMRISLNAAPTATSSFTVSPGGQVELISDGTYTLGTGNLNLSGIGATTGPFAAFPGALRPSTGTVISITNNTVLTGTTQIVSVTNGTTGAGSLTFSGNVSGTGALLIDGAGAGRGAPITLAGTNSYAGGTTVSNGPLIAGAASVNAFGTGDVFVNNVGGAPSSVTISAGAINAIADTATLDLDGGGTAGVIVLGAGVNEIVGGLVLGGVTQTTPGTYGSTSSLATFQNDTYFGGTGVLTLVPEPATLSLLGVGAAACLTRRRRRSA